jgi:hypothetical protein
METRITANFTWSIGAAITLKKLRGYNRISLILPFFSISVQIARDNKDRRIYF